MPSWKKVLISGSDAALNSLNVTAALTASGLYYPTSDGNSGEVLITDGLGNLSFTNISSGYGATIKLNQSVAATTWSFAHNTGEKYPVVNVYDTNDEIIVPGEIQAVDSNNLTIYFDSPTAGTAIAVVGGVAVTASYVHFDNIDGKPSLISGSQQIASDISGSFTSLSSSIASDIEDIIDGTTLVASASLAQTASYILSNNVLGPLGFNSVLTSSYSLTSSYNENPIVSGSISGADWIDFSSQTGNTVPYAEGRLFYDSENGALAFYNDEADITLQIGQEFYKRVFNNSGQRIDNGTPVRISGSQGDLPYIWPAFSTNIYDGNYDFQENKIIGVATHHIEDNTIGYITEKGVVRGVDTTAFAAGDTLYLQTGSATFRNTAPPFPYDVIRVGTVVRSLSNGFIELSPLRPIVSDTISGVVNMSTQVVNAESFTLPKGTPVYVSSSFNGPVTNVKMSMANDPSTMPASFVLSEELTAGQQGQAHLKGYIFGVDTSALEVGDTVYVAPNGGYTNQIPTGSNELVQNLGIVTVKSSTEGAGFIYGTGRVASVPNMPGGKIWVGDDYGHFVTSSIITLDEPNSQLQVTGSAVITGTVSATSYTGIFVGALSSSLQIASDISGSFTSVSSSIASDIEDIIDGTTTVASSSYAFTSSYASTFNINGTGISTQQNIDVDTGTETVATVSTTVYDGAFFDYIAKDGTNFRAGTVMSVWDGSSIQYTDTSTQDIGDTTGVVLSVDISGTDARLRATVSSDNWTIKAFVRAI